MTAPKNRVSGAVWMLRPGLGVFALFMGLANTSSTALANPESASEVDSLDVSGGLPADEPKPLCVGILGNGPRIFAHFGSIGRIADHYGPPDCAAGGSSGSITTFLIESIAANPLSRVCDGRPCKRADRWARAALMYKSAAGLTDAGLGLDVQVLLDILAEIQARDIQGLLESDPAAGVAALTRVLADFGDIVNPEVFVLLAQSPDPVFHARDLIQGLVDGLQFNANSPLILCVPAS